MDDLISRIIGDFSWRNVLELWPQMLLVCSVKDIRRHPLGMLQINFFESDENALRIHIWMPGMRPVQEPSWVVHAHNFDLQSIVLCGELTNKSFEWLPSDKPKKSRLFEARHYGNTSVLTATDSFGEIRQLSSIRVLKGAEYSVTCGDFHETEVAPDLFTATLAYVRKRTGYPIVVGEEEGDRRFAYERTILSSLERDEIINEVTRQFIG